MSFSSVLPILSMDSPVLNQLFRQLFRHPHCHYFRSIRSLPPRAPPSVRLSGTSRSQCRSFLTRRTTSKRKSSDDGMTWNKRGDYPRDISEEFRTYPLVTARDLRSRRERPRQVKMMTREFIDGMSDCWSSSASLIPATSCR